MIALLEDALPGRMKASAVHLGGGTPNMLRPEELSAIFGALKYAFRFMPGYEIAAELDPAVLTRAWVDAAAFHGLSRASLGVQNLDPVVQAAVNRPERFEDIARCVGWLLMQSSGKDRIEIETNAGRLAATRAGERLVSVDMGPPRLDWREIPLAEEHDTRALDVPLYHHAALMAPAGCVSMGNPHVVFFVPDVEQAPVTEAGPAVETHPLFPEHVNVGFAQVKGRDRIRLRVWERGAGLTKACGTGACAALVAASRRDLVGRYATLELDGGELFIEWREDGHVVMTGPAAVDGTGELP